MCNVLQPGKLNASLADFRPLLINYNQTKELGNVKSQMQTADVKVFLAFQADKINVTYTFMSRASPADDPVQLLACRALKNWDNLWQRRVV